MSLRSLAALLLFALPAAVVGEPPPGLRFRERARELGIDFVHRHFGTGEKYMPENMGSGVALFDFDGDGRLDVYLVQGAPIGPGREAGGAAVNRLFRQLAGGTFEDVTSRAGVGDTGYGMGASYGDVDADGDLDLYVTNFGPNVLFRNRGDGTFEEVAAETGVSCPPWSTGAGFFDPDADGDLDLLVVNYLDFAFDHHKWCGNAQAGVRSYCHPDVYGGLADVFYENDGGVFAEASAGAGIVREAESAKGLGLVFADLDGDGAQDAYVANDSTPNHLYLGDGRGRFREEALLAGLAVNGAGAPEAGMGVALGDVDGDGRADVFLTHLDEETNTLYRHLGGGLWADATAAAGLAAPSLPWVGFGTVLFDPDGDGDLDLFVANGHILDNVELFAPGRSHRQPAQLFANGGSGRFREVSGALGLAAPLVGRGAAAGDLDGDGDPDLVVTQNGGRALLLRNEGVPAGRDLTVRLRGRRSNPQGFGAVLELRENGRRQVRHLVSASSYLSQGPPEVRFALATDAGPAELTIRWPAGRIERYRGLHAGSIYTITEGTATRASR